MWARAVAWALLAPAGWAQAAEPITGRAFDALAAGAVDVMRLHQWTLKSQMDRDAVARVYEASLRSMSGDFVDVDGNVIESDLARFLHTNWFGKGNPRTGTAWYAGMQIDAAIIGSGSLGSLPYNGQLLLFGGLCGRGWQGSVALRGDHHQGVYDDGRFVQGLLVESGAADETDGGSVGVIVTLQHQNGASLGAIVDNRGLRLRGDRRDVASALRALIQPEAAMERADARGAGVPSIAIERLGAGIDPWFEADVGEVAPAVVQAPLALDDIGRLGLRVRVTPEVWPQPSLRIAEGAYTWIGNRVAFGGRGGVWRSRGEWSPAGEASATWITGRQDDGTEGLALTFSAAHNVPDSATFFVIPDATVLGLSVTFGPLDQTHATVPVLASQLRHGR